MMDQDGCIGVFLQCRYNLALEYRNTTTILRKFDAFSIATSMALWGCQRVIQRLTRSETLCLMSLLAACCQSVLLLAVC